MNKEVYRPGVRARLESLQYMTKRVLFFRTLFYEINLYYVLYFVNTIFFTFPFTTSEY
jgi:hypothetical protein